MKIVTREGQGMGRTKCIRCRRDIEQKDGLGALTGACESCLGSLLSAGGNAVSEYLESLPYPAALVAHDHTVLFFNRRFQGLTFHDEVGGLRIGEVLDCMYTASLGRCGETVACLLCRLRGAVEHTWTTGEGLRAVTMSYPHKAETRRAFTITTEKLGAAVLLLVENPSEPTLPRGAARV